MSTPDHYVAAALFEAVPPPAAERHLDWDDVLGRAATRKGIEIEARQDRGRSTQWRRRGVLLALAAAVGMALVVAWPTDRGTTDAVIERAAAALMPTQDQILHVRADGHNIYSPWSETWRMTAGPIMIRSRVAGSNAEGPCTIEFSYDAAARTMATWDAPTETIYWHRVDERTEKEIGFPDPMREIRAHLAAGDLREAGRQTINGRAVIRLEPADGVPTGGEGRPGDANFAYAVDASTYEPVRWEISPTQWYDYTTYEYLPNNEQTRELLSLEAQHPAAARVEGSPPDPARSCGFG